MGEHPAFLCTCHEVTEARVREVISAHRLRNVVLVGVRTGAGTGCGSCRAEIARLIREILGESPDYSIPSESPRAPGTIPAAGEYRLP